MVYWASDVGVMYEILQAPESKGHSDENAKLGSSAHDWTFCGAGGPRGCGCVTSWREVLRVFNVAFAFFFFSFIELSRTMES